MLTKSKYFQILSLKLKKFFLLLYPWNTKPKYFNFFLFFLLCGVSCQTKRHTCCSIGAGCVDWEMEKGSGRGPEEGTEIPDSLYSRTLLLFHQGGISANIPTISQGKDFYSILFRSILKVQHLDPGRLICLFSVIPAVAVIKPLLNFLFFLISPSPCW